MRDKSTLSNINNSNPSDYPNGRIQDNTGAGNGTPVNEFMYGDIHEMIAKLMRLAGIPFNGLPDNESNGYQTVDALIALASKNDYLIEVTASGTTISLPLKVSRLKLNESFVGKVNFSKTNQTTVKGSLDNSSKPAIFEGDFLDGEYVRIVSKENSILFVRLVDFNSLDAMALSLNFLKAATVQESIDGVLNNVGLTPQSFLAAFAEYVIGGESDNFLSAISRNGLMSQEDKTKLDGLGSSSLRNRGYFTGLQIDGQPTGTNYAVDGDVSSATKSDNSGNTDIIRVTLSNPMDNLNYFVRTSVESLGDPFKDSLIQQITFRKISTSIVDIVVRESGNVTQNLKIHIETIQL